MTVIRTTTALVLSLAAVLAAPGRAHAYRTLADQDGLPDGLRVGWRETIQYQLASDPVDGLTEAQVQEIVSAAFAAWGAAGCSTPALVGLGRGPDGAMSGDGIVSIAFVRRDWVLLGLPPDAAASTDVIYEVSPDGREARIVDADILVNADLFSWRGAPEDPRVRALRPVLIHEIGHALGLAHNCETSGSGRAPACSTIAAAADSTMYPLYQPDLQSAVRADDASGLCFLYGTMGAPCPDSCTGETACRDGRCVPLECASAGCEVCTEDTQCSGYCEAGFCRRPLRAGAPCERAAQCLVGSCGADGLCPTMCGPTACAPGEYCSPPGACVRQPADFALPCDAPSECRTGFCVTSERHGNFCSVECTATSGCPDDYRCAMVEVASVCVPPSSSTSCVAQPWRPAASTLPLLVLVALLGARRLK